MRILIGIITCETMRDRANACRETWVPHVRGADVEFFCGRTNSKFYNEIQLDVSDNYESLSYKVQAMFTWALNRGYDYVCKVDDDVYCSPQKLLISDFKHDYVGPKSASSKKFPYASGFIHWVSRRSMEILSAATIDDIAEDRWTGKVLHKAGINLYIDDRYKIINVFNPQNLPLTGTVGPLVSNDVIAVGELGPSLMKRIYEYDMFPLRQALISGH